MLRFKNGKPEISRSMYKDIKKLDHHQMEVFIQGVYEQGVMKGHEAGMLDARVEVDREVLVKHLAGVKGIGLKRLEEILSLLPAAIEEMQYGQGKADS